MHKSKAIPKLHTNYMHHFCLVSVVLFGTGKVKLVKLYSLVWTHDKFRWGMSYFANSILIFSKLL